MAAARRASNAPMADGGAGGCAGISSFTAAAAATVAEAPGTTGSSASETELTSGSINEGTVEGTGSDSQSEDETVSPVAPSRVSFVPVPTGASERAPAETTASEEDSGAEVSFAAWGESMREGVDIADTD